MAHIVRTFSAGSTLALAARTASVRALLALFIAFAAVLPTGPALAQDGPRITSTGERADGFWRRIVTWTGVTPLTPGRDYIGLFRPDAPDDRPLVSFPITAPTGTLSIDIPRETGRFEIRLVMNGRWRHKTTFELTDAHYQQPAQPRPQQPVPAQPAPAQPAPAEPVPAQPVQPGPQPTAAPVLRFEITDASSRRGGVSIKAPWAAADERVPFTFLAALAEGPLAGVMRQVTWRLADGQELPTDPEAVTLNRTATATVFSWSDSILLPAEVAQAILAAGQQVASALYTVTGVDGQGRERVTSTDVSVTVDAAPAQPAAPVLAWYYPQFSKGAPQDVANMQRAGVDTVILSQTGYDPGRPLRQAPVVDALRGTNMTFTVGIETNVMYRSQEQLANELKRLVSEEVHNPRWLRYQGKPVIIFWALPQVPLSGPQTPQGAWESIRAQADPNRTTIWIAEGGDANPTTGTMSFLPTFDGLHLYSVAWDAEPGRALQGWERRVRGVPNKLWVATVMPGGYYGAGIVSSDQWSYRDRQEGGYFTRAWQGAIATRPAMVILTSYNEEKERTGIYPESTDAGPDPGFYLDINRRLGDQWRASVGAAPYASASAQSSGG
jgi:hypothetical protein